MYNHGNPVVLVCDGEKRHHSKRATILRCSQANDKVALYLTGCQIINSSTEVKEYVKEDEKDNLISIQEKLN